MALLVSLRSHKHAMVSRTRTSTTPRTSNRAGRFKGWGSGPDRFDAGPAALPSGSKLIPEVTRYAVGVHRDKRPTIGIERTIETSEAPVTLRRIRPSSARERAGTAGTETAAFARSLVVPCSATNGAASAVIRRACGLAVRRRGSAVAVAIGAIDRAGRFHSIGTERKDVLRNPLESDVDEVTFDRVRSHGRMPAGRAHVDVREPTGNVIVISPGDERLICRLTAQARGCVGGRLDRDFMRVCRSAVRVTRAEQTCGGNRHPNRESHRHHPEALESPRNRGLALEITRSGQRVNRLARHASDCGELRRSTLR